MHMVIKKNRVINGRQLKKRFLQLHHHRTYVKYSMLIFLTRNNWAELHIMVNGINQQTLSKHLIRFKKMTGTQNKINKG